MCVPNELPAECGRSLALLGASADATGLDGARGVVYDAATQLAFVASAGADSLAVVDVSDPSGPSLLGFVKDGTRLDGAAGVAYEALSRGRRRAIEARLQIGTGARAVFMLPGARACLFS